MAASHSKRRSQPFGTDLNHCQNNQIDPLRFIIQDIIGNLGDKFPVVTGSAGR
jgi:hypothetical protein